MPENPYKSPEAEEIGQTRPKGVWIATIWAGLFAGLLPMAAVLVLYFGPGDGDGFLSGPQFGFALLLALGVISLSIATWRGRSIARYGLVVFVVIHYALIAYQNYQLAAAGVEIRGGNSLFWARVIRSVVTACVIAAYLLLSRKANDFFSRKRGPVMNQGPG